MLNNASPFILVSLVKLRKYVFVCVSTLFSHSRGN